MTSRASRGPLGVIDRRCDIGAIHVHEFMSLDGVFEEPTWTFAYGFPEEREGGGALRLGDRLRPQIRGADGVCVRNDVSTAILVAANRKREAEGKDQADDSQ